MKQSRDWSCLASMSMASTLSHQVDRNYPTIMFVIHLESLEPWHTRMASFLIVERMNPCPIAGSADRRVVKWCGVVTLGCYAPSEASRVCCRIQRTNESRLGYRFSG